jgi:hypothetical protein
MHQSEQINELAAALAKAQAEIQPAIKDSINPYFKSKYADLASVWSACKDALTKNGLAVLQTMDNKEGQLVLFTTLVHASGQWMRSCLPVLSAKQDAQSIGSAITYMRRYSLAAMVGVTTDEDDDGNAASQNSSQSKSEPHKNGSPPLISKEEAQELEEMLNLCDEAFRTNVRNYLKSLSISNFSQLPRANYVPLRKRIANKVDELENEVAHV